MELAPFIQQYGYLALFAATICEGETVVILAGFAAHEGYLNLDYVIIFAFLGAYIGDQILFHVGRLRGAAILTRKPHWQRKVLRINHWLGSFRDLVIVGVRFVYGFRVITLLAIGAGGIPWRRFAVFSLFSAAAWSTIMSLGGYYVGVFLSRLLGDIRRWELRILIGIAVAGFLIWIFSIWRSRAAHPY